MHKYALIAVLQTCFGVADVTYIFLYFIYMFPSSLYYRIAAHVFTAIIVSRFQSLPPFSFLSHTDAKCSQSTTFHDIKLIR